MENKSGGEVIYSRMLMAEGTNEVEYQVNHNGDCLKRFTFHNEAEKDRFFEQDSYGWPHASPGSTTVIAVGNRWKKSDEEGNKYNCELMVREMCTHTQKQGYKVLFEEVPVWFGNFPMASVASAREHGALLANMYGTEYVFFVDNDIMPEPELLTELLSYNSPIIVPMVIDSRHNQMLGGPIREKHSGVWGQKWASMSALLMKTCLLDLPGVKFVHSDTEGLFYQRIARWGHTIHMDTSQILYTATPPTRPDSMSFEAREERYRNNYSHMFERREPMDKLAQELFDEAKETGKENIVKTIKM